MNLWGIGFVTTTISAALLTIGYWAGRESRRRQRPATQRRVNRKKVWCDDIDSLTIEPAAFDPAELTVKDGDFEPGRCIL